jgi:hypothetical protein
MSSTAAKWLHALDRLGERDRAAVLAALIAVVIGLDMLVVMPLNTQRKAMLEGIAATTQSNQQALADAQQQRQEQALSLDRRQAQVDKDLESFGLNNSLKDSLSFMLSRTLHNQAVTTQGLRALQVEEIKLDEPANPEVAEAAAPLDAIPEHHPSLYRHRYELVLHSEPKNIGPALDALENDSRPLRVESVHLQALPSGTVEMTVMLVTIGLEKTWLAL